MNQSRGRIDLRFEQADREDVDDLLSMLQIVPFDLLLDSKTVQAVWGDVAVTDESITKCVADIRKALLVLPRAGVGRPLRRTPDLRGSRAPRR
jgi:hypothetical protein